MVITPNSCSSTTGKYKPLSPITQFLNVPLILASKSKSSAGVLTSAHVIALMEEKIKKKEEEKEPKKQERRKK